MYVSLQRKERPEEMIDEYPIGEMCQKYYSIKQQIFEAKEPPTTKRFQERFSKLYGIKLTDTEFVELRDYAENDYPYDMPDMRGEEIKL